MKHKTFIVNYNAEIDGASVEIANNDIGDFVVLNGIPFVSKEQIHEPEVKIKELEKEYQLLYANYCALREINENLKCCSNCKHCYDTKCIGKRRAWRVCDGWELFNLTNKERKI